MSIAEKLMRIQTEIKAPKNLYNNFGKYHYRNAEGICEAVKPYLEKEKCVLTLTDSIVEVGGRIYVEAIATLTDCESDTFFATTAYARESLEKKGMDDSQITGTASSYARKYALNGLFLLDDTKDADTDEYKQQIDDIKAQEQDQKKTEEIGRKNIATSKVMVLRKMCVDDGIEESRILELCKVKKLEDITEAKFRNIIDNWEKVKG